LEYVVVHEMTHLLERLHNDRFKGILDRVMPHWRQVKDKLKEELMKQDYPELEEEPDRVTALQRKPEKKELIIATRHFITALENDDTNRIYLVESDGTKLEIGIVYPNKLKKKHVRYGFEITEGLGESMKSIGLRNRNDAIIQLCKEWIRFQPSTRQAFRSRKIYHRTAYVFRMLSYILDLVTIIDAVKIKVYGRLKGDIPDR
jgi:galactitol-specific phosphotransferase system IIB component